MKAFFDTNILVYTATSDARKQRAVDCLGRGGVVSAQVLNEFVHVARRKLHHDWPQVELALGVDNVADRRGYQAHPYPGRTVFTELRASY